VHVLEALRLAGRPCSAVCITTDKCYENREWLHGYREEDAMGGYDPYSASKGAAELAIASYRQSCLAGSPVRVASARAGNVLGGGDWAADRIVPDCFRSLLRGEPVVVRNRIATRPWQHVLEPLSGYLWLGAALAEPSYLQRPDESAFAGAFNFGPALTSNRTVAELVEEVLKHTPGQWLDASDPNAPHEASNLNLAIDKAFHLLQWQPVWNFGETIARTAEWYLHTAGDPVARTSAQTAAYTADAAKLRLPWALAAAPAAAL
jgi:CDP-glucose 4,6-dehydratase